MTTAYFADDNRRTIASKTYTGAPRDIARAIMRDARQMRARYVDYKQ